MNDLFKDLGDELRPEKMKMDKIKEAFEKAFPYNKMFTESEQDYRFFTAGFKSANLLPTEKTCPVCGGMGKQLNVYGDCTCKHCKGTGKIQIYYTPEEFKTIMGYDYPDDAYVLVYLLGKWIFDLYGRILDEYKSVCVIVQTAQKCPGADYKKEMIK